MKMYHPDSKDSIDVHPSQVESARNNGWTPTPATEKAVTVKIKQADKPKTTTD